MRKYKKLPEEEFRKKYNKTTKTQGSDKQWAFFQDLIKTKDFQESLQRFRDRYDQARQSENIFARKRVDNDLRFVLQHYDLDSEMWLDPVIDYMNTGSIEKPEGIDMCDLSSLSDLRKLILSERDDETEDDRRLPEYELNDQVERCVQRMNLSCNYPAVLLINKNATQRDLIDYIKANFEVRIKYQLVSVVNYEDTSGIGIGKSRPKDKKISGKTGTVSFSL